MLTDTVTPTARALAKLDALADVERAATWTPGMGRTIVAALIALTRAAVARAEARGVFEDADALAPGESGSSPEYEAWNEADGVFDAATVALIAALAGEGVDDGAA